MVSVQVWRVENFDLKPMDKSRYGEFFGGDCYVIQYTYEVHGRENVIIYYWLVSEQGLEWKRMVELLVWASVVLPRKSYHCTASGRN